MSFGDASQTFTLLTIGDGLVTQIPALIVSTAAGMMVSKGGVEGSSEKALLGQLSHYPQALAMAAFVMAVVAVLPGMPHVVFALIAAGTGGLAYVAWRGKETMRAGSGATGSGKSGRSPAAKSRSQPRSRSISCAWSWAMGSCP
jgi:flagellar biosynthesis protein FlhA